MKYFLYARKSTDEEDRQVRSIDAQLTEMRELAEAESLFVAREFIESKTAKTPGRPIFNDMIERIEKGEAEGILAWHPDRIARNALDGGKIIHLLDAGELQALKFKAFWFENSPQGKFMLSIAFGQSKYYVDNLSENVWRGIREKLRRGEYPGKAPVGYLNDPTTRMIIQDSERAPLVQRMFRAFATDRYNLAELREMTIAWGLVNKRQHPIALAWFCKLLSDPFYVGMFRYDGFMYEGSHDALVSSRLFHRVQKILIRRRSRRRSNNQKRFAFRGMMRCGECGGTITAETQKGHNYYRCTKRKGPCTLRCLREEDLVDQLRKSVRSVSLTTERVERMRTEIHGWQTAGNRRLQEVTAQHREEIDKCSMRLERLESLRIDRVVDEDTYARKKEEVLYRKALTTEKLTSIETHSGGWLGPMFDFLSAAEQARLIALSGSVDDIKEFHKQTGSRLVLDHAHPVEPHLPGKQKRYWGPEGYLFRELLKYFTDGDEEWIREYFDKYKCATPEEEAAEPKPQKPQRSKPVLKVFYPKPWRVLAIKQKNRSWRQILDALYKDIMLQPCIKPGDVHTL